MGRKSGEKNWNEVGGRAFTFHHFDGMIVSNRYRFPLVCVAGMHPSVF
jgi:hypothetical protein